MSGLSFSLKLQGAQELLSGLTKVKEGVRDTLQAGMKEAAFVVEAEAKREITVGSNRAIKTGYLRSSIAVKSIAPYRATVEAGANYGIFIHEGTRYMRARPFLAAGLKDAIPEIERIFGRRVKTLVELI